MRSLRAENKSPRTVETYGDACRGLAEYLGTQGMPSTIDAISREHVEAFIEDQLRRWKPATRAEPLSRARSILRVGGRLPGVRVVKDA
jgi:hypothetical protein